MQLWWGLSIKLPLSIQVGDPEEEGVFMGALNSKPHLEKVRRYMEYAVEDGGQGRSEYVLAYAAALGPDYLLLVVLLHGCAFLLLRDRE